MRLTKISAFLSLLTVSTVVASPFSFGSDDQQALSTGPIKTTDSWGYEDCGEPEYPIQIESLEVFPDPPQPGKNLTVKVKAYVTETIEDGAYADVTVKLGLVKLLEKTFDVCEEARNANASIQCPVEAGPHVVEQTVELPKEIPKAKFQVFINGYTVEDEEMLCLNLKVDFMKNPFPRPRKFW